MLGAFLKYSLLLLLGSLGGVERYTALQFSILRPFPSSIILGALFGHMGEMMILGIIFETLWIGKIPVGSYVPPHETIAFYSAAIFFLLLRAAGNCRELALSWGIFWGIGNGIVGKRIDLLERLVNLRIARWVENEIKEGEAILNRGLLYSLVSHFLINFFYLTFVLIISIPSALIISGEFNFHGEIYRVFITSLLMILLISYYFSLRTRKLKKSYTITSISIFIIFLIIFLEKWIG